MAEEDQEHRKDNRKAKAKDAGIIRKAKAKENSPPLTANVDDVDATDINKQIATARKTSKADP